MFLHYRRRARGPVHSRPRSRFHRYRDLRFLHRTGPVADGAFRQRRHLRGIRRRRTAGREPGGPAPSSPTTGKFRSRHGSVAACRTVLVRTLPGSLHPRGGYHRGRGFHPAVPGRAAGDVDPQLAETGRGDSRRAHFHQARHLCDFYLGREHRQRLNRIGHGPDTDDSQRYCDHGCRGVLATCAPLCDRDGRRPGDAGDRHGGQARYSEFRPWRGRTARLIIAGNLPGDRRAVAEPAA